MSFVGNKPASVPNDARRDPGEEDAELQLARQGIMSYLDGALADGRIDRQLYDDAVKLTYRIWNTGGNSVRCWNKRFRPGLTKGLRTAIAGAKWESIVNAYRQAVRFGTGGIRGMMLSTGLHRDDARGQTRHTCADSQGAQHDQ